MQHLRGEDAAGRQQRRDSVLGTSADDLRQIAAALEKIAQSGTVKVVGSAEAVAGYGGFESQQTLL